MSSTPCNTLESCLARFATSSIDRQEQALRAFSDVLRGEPPLQTEELLSLKELGRRLGYHPSHLWRLGIHSIDEKLGGRPKYRLSKAIDYLRSPECQRRREDLRNQKEVER